MPNETHWRITALIALVFALIFFWPYLGIVCFAAMSAFLFHGVYRKIDRYLPSVIASGLTMTIAIILVAVPIGIILLIALSQGIAFVNGIAANISDTTPGSAREDVIYIVNQINIALSPISNGTLHITAESVQYFFATLLPSLLGALLAALLSIVGSLPALFTNGTIYLFTFFIFLIKGEQLTKDIKLTSPFENKTTSLYFYRIGAMVKASVVSQLLIAFVLAVLTAFLLTIIGLGPYFAFLVVLLTLLNMVPLGSAPVIYILSGAAIVSGNVAGGIIVFLVYSLIICNIDNFMRPRLIPKAVRLNSGLMVLSIFCGLYYFGGLGLFYGPIIAIVLVTTFEVFLEYRRKVLTSKGATPSES